MLNQVTMEQALSPNITKLLSSQIAFFHPPNRLPQGDRGQGDREVPVTKLS